MSFNLIVAFLALGAAVGFAAGLLGVGGGMLLVPFITVLLAAREFPHELILHMAIATSLATILLTSMSSVLAHHRNGAVRWDIVKLLAPGILVGSWIGPWIGKQMNSTALALFFAVFIALSATQMLIDKKTSGSRELPAAPGMFGVGGLIGLLAGLVGAGGGFISVPFMTWCNVKIHQAVATSAALGFPIALAGTLSNIYFGMAAPDLPAGSLGFVYLPALLVISPVSMLTAPLGAKAAHALPMKTLRKVFAITLFALAAYMLSRAFR